MNKVEEVGGKKGEKMGKKVSVNNRCLAAHLTVTQ
jgi:hypothetical protein